MYNWNPHMRGAGFPMQFPGAHHPQVPYQFQQSQWTHQQQGIGMMMTPNWHPAAQHPMYSSHRMQHRLMTSQMTAMMGGQGPSPPSQPPPPLPAEPPPLSPKAQPTPPLPAQKDTHVSPQQEKSTQNRWDQAGRKQSSFPEKDVAPDQPRPPQSPPPDLPKPPESPAPGQPKPPESPAPGQPRPPQSPAPGQPKPPHSPAPGQPKPPESPAPGQPKPPQSPASGQPKPPQNLGQPKPPQNLAANKVNPQGPTTNQFNPRGSIPHQGNPTRLGSNKFNARGPSSIQINIRAQAPSEVNSQKPPPNQVNPTGPGPNQVNPTGPGPNQVNSTGPGSNKANPTGPGSHQVSSAGLGSNQVSSTGPGPNLVNPTGPGPNSANSTGPDHNQVNLTGPGHNKVNPTGSGHNKVNPTGPGPNQINARGPVSSQVNLRGSGPNQVNSTDLGSNQVYPQGSALNEFNPTDLGPNKVNPYRSSPGQTAPQRPASNQIFPRGPAQNQVNSQSSSLTQADLYQFQAPSQSTHQGAGETGSNQRTVSGPPPQRASVPESDQLHSEETLPDPVLVAELEKVKMEESQFMEQYKQWKQQYDDWRQQNQNHPNKQQFEQYLEQWRTYELQMEIRRNGIQLQKQAIEDRLSRSLSSPVVSQLGPHRDGTHGESDHKENVSLDRFGKPCWDRDGQQLHFRETHPVKPQDKLSGDPSVNPSQRGDISKAVGPAGQVKGNAFSGSLHHGGNISSAVQQSSYGVDEDKGEEDMNLDDEEEFGGGGIIESEQRVDRHFWPEKVTTDSDSLQKSSGVGWEQWNQGPDSLGRSQRNNLSRAAAAESAGPTGWTDQRGSHQDSQEASMGRGDWNGFDSARKSTIDPDLPFMDSDLRLTKPAGAGGYGQLDDEYNEGQLNDRRDDEFSDRSAYDFQSSMGGFMTQRGGDNGFQRGRGGVSDLRGRGRGGEFQMGQGDYRREIGGDNFRGWGGNVPLGRGDYQGGRRGDFQMGMSGDLMNDGESGMFNSSEDFERFRGPSRGRGRGALPSLLAFEAPESLRHRLADCDPIEEEARRREQDTGYNNLGDQGQEVARAREATRFFNCQDEDDSSDFPPRARREIGVGVRGGVGGGRGRGGFRGDVVDRDNQSDLSLCVRGQGGVNNNAFIDDQRFPQQGRGGTRGGTVFNGSEELQIPGELNLRDDISGSMRRREVESGNLWENQQDDNIVAQFDRPRIQQNSEAAPGSDLLNDMARSRRRPDEDEPEAKKGRLSLDDEREGKSRHMAPYPGDPYRTSFDDRKTYRDYRDPYAEPFSGRPAHGFDRQISDRFGVRSSEPSLERRSLLPAESIDYGHGGVDMDSLVVKPTEVIDYGHGQSTGGKAATLAVDRDRFSHPALADRSYPDALRGGAELRASRESHEMNRMSELRDRESTIRRPETSVRVATMGVLPRYGLRGELLSEEAGRGAAPGRGWLGDSRDDDFDVRADRSSIRDRFNEDDDLRSGHRMPRFSSRDHQLGHEAKLYKDQGDDRPILREHGLSSGSRDRDDYPGAEDFYGRRGDAYGNRPTDIYADQEYIHDQDQYPDEEDYVAPARDARFGGSTGVDVYSREDRSRGHALDRDGYSRALSSPSRSTPPLKAPAATALLGKSETVKVEDLLCHPNRESRPPQIVTIIRGLPGSGKTYTSKLLREKESSCGGAAPRMLCLDDYFMVEMEREVVEPDTGRKVKKRVLEYEYEQALEETYRQSLLKSFKKTVDDGFFPFIIVDATNEKVAHFSEFWSYAKSKGFQVYVGEMNADVPMCIQRNVHNWTEWDIEKVKNSWEPLPSHYIRLDLRWLLQEDSIPEVIMEDTQADEEAAEDVAEDDEESDLKEAHSKSKWELDTSGETLDKLDGIRVSKKHIAEHQSLNDYLQLDQMDDDYFSRESLPGKKRVRWADLEEKKNQSRRRNLGFIVGQTQQDWDRFMDDDLATKALNQTKYFYKN